MIFTYHSAQNLTFKLLAHLSDKIANSKRNITLKDVISVFCHPNKVELDFILGMTASTVFHTRDLNPTTS